MRPFDVVGSVFERWLFWLSLTVSLEAQLPASELVEPFLLSKGWRPCEAMLPKTPSRFPPQRNQLATGCHSNHINLSQSTINDVGKRHVEERYGFAYLMLLRVRVGGGEDCEIKFGSFLETGECLR